MCLDSNLEPDSGYLPVHLNRSILILKLTYSKYWTIQLFFVVNTIFILELPLYQSPCSANRLTKRCSANIASLLL